MRIISIQPGNAVHYLKKVKSDCCLDLPSVFWQAQYQFFDKTFLMEECEFPYSMESNIFAGPPNEDETIVLKNVILTQQKSQSIRIFFTLNDTAMMVVAHKPGQSEHSDTATIQEVITLTAEAKEKYEKYYLSLLIKPFYQH